MDIHTKYRSLIRYPKEDAIQALNGYKHITIREKVDGANASVRELVSAEVVDGELKTYSRTKELTGENGLNGFRAWILQSGIEKYLEAGTRVYGEWLTRHKVRYADEAYKKFYMFNVWDYAQDCYQDPAEHKNLIMAAIEIDGLEFAPLLYAGKYQGVEHIESFMDESMLGAEKPEGVVVMDYDYRNRFGNNVAVKFVNKEFIENEGKIKPPKVITSEEMVVIEFVNTTLTDNRVEKQIMKFQDEGTLPESLFLNNMGDVMKILPKALIEDIFKEELDELIALLPDSEVDVLKKLIGNKIGRMTGQIARNIIGRENN